MGKICFDVDEFRAFIEKAFEDPDIFLDFNKFKVWNKKGWDKTGCFILEGVIIEDQEVEK